MVEQADYVKILIATDLHIGYAEKILNRDMDSIRAFEEVLQIATAENVDFVLLGGDLYHENNPSREMQHRVIRLLRRYCYNDRPVAVRFLSDPAANFTHSAFESVNYEDSNINVGLPVFTIHGNHDDLTGKGLTALDVLHESGLINLFGKFEEIDKFVVSPLLMKKGETNLAIYGIGSQRDDRLCRAFREEEIQFLRPKENTESWFNILVLHQNRPVRTRNRSTGAHVPESLIPNFFDLVIWGHEHECKIDPQYYESGVDKTGDGFYIIQPGSTVATMLTPEEAKPKHVSVVTITGRKFTSKAIKLETPRQILIDDLMITSKPPAGASKAHRTKKMPDETLIIEKIEEMLKAGEITRTARQPQLPLFRLRVTYTDAWENILKLNCRLFGVKFAKRVANPASMITVKILKPKKEHKKERSHQKLLSDMERTTTVEEIVSEHFTTEGNDKLLVLTTSTLNNFVKSQVQNDDGRIGRNKQFLESIHLEKKQLVENLFQTSLNADENPDTMFDGGKSAEKFEETVDSIIRELKRSSRLDISDRKLESDIVI